MRAKNDGHGGNGIKEKKEEKDGEKKRREKDKVGIYDKFTSISQLRL